MGRRLYDSRILRYARKRRHYYLYFHNTTCWFSLYPYHKKTSLSKCKWLYHFRYHHWPSKKDISHVFNAEAFIIGLISGCIGIGVTVLLDIPISIIVENLTGVTNIASLPVAGGVILILISLLLTTIAGLIPSRIASKKDPVEALRTE